MVKSDFSASQFEEAVAQQILATGTYFQREVPIRGIQADFIAAPSRDRTVLFEVKNWEPTAANLQRASDQARLIQQVTGSTEAYIILPGQVSREAPSNVIGLVDVHKVIGNIQPPPGDEVSCIPWPHEPPPKMVFAAMPFEAVYDDTYLVAMRYACENAGAVLERVDQEPFEGDVVKKIHDLVEQSAAVIADLSESRPNVMYEVGYARGKNRPMIPICSTPLDELPFDVRNWNILSYTRGQTVHLQEPLTKRLKTLLR